MDYRVNQRVSLQLFRQKNLLFYFKYIYSSIHFITEVMINEIFLMKVL